MIFPVQGFFDLVGFGSCSDSQEYTTLRINTEECAVRYILALLSQFSNITKVYGSCLKESISHDPCSAGYFCQMPASSKHWIQAIKRNTAVIKKLKQINEEQKEGLLEELRVVNLSKFVSEAVTAITDAKL